MEVKSLIELKNVSKTYNNGRIKAVDGVNLVVNHGEIFGFLGPNGAGKTTTIKMIVGILKPDEGEILVDGIDIQKNPIEAKKKIGYVPDEPYIYEKLTGLEYLNFIADMYGVPEKERREKTEYFLEIFELKSAIGDLIQSYSHGMKQKLLITAALLHNPSVWILDEPMTGLDPKSSFILKELMANHTQKGFTVFFSTHVLEVAEKLCDRIAIINKGKIVTCGTMEEIKKQHEWESLEKIFLELTEK